MAPFDCMRRSELATSAPSAANGKTAKQAKAPKAGKSVAKAPPKPAKLDRKIYEKALQKLQVELCHLQEWVKEVAAMTGAAG